MAMTILTVPWLNSGQEIQHIAPSCDPRQLEQSPVSDQPGRLDSEVSSLTLSHAVVKTLLLPV